MTVEAFDLSALPRVARAELAAQAQLRAAHALVRPAQVAAAFATLLAVPVEVGVVRTRDLSPAAISVSTPPHPSAALVSSWVAPASDPTRVFRVEVEPALAREVVARALKHPASPLVDASKPPGADLQGAFAAVLLAALRTLGTPLQLEARAVLPTESTTAQLRVTIAGSTFSARVTFPRLETHAPSATDLARLGEAPLSLRIVATSCIADRTEVEALEPGDVFLFGAPLIEGSTVALLAPGEERGVAARVGAGNKLVITTVPAVHSWDPPMTNDPKAPLDVALDAPVVVRVEVGSISMTAREWAALNDGDVVATGVTLAGAPAVLRLGGVEVARGELVNVDGEYGVRIVGTIKR